MHIPDGFLGGGIEAAMGVLSTGVLGYSLRKTYRRVDKEQVLALGATAAFVFSAQMVNFEVAMGTSGHFVGALFAAILFGPFLANILMTVLLVVQMAVFQDGGLLALGANVFNMGVAGIFGGYLVYGLMKELVGGRYGILVGAFAAGWVSVVLAAIFCALQLGLSGVFSLPALLGSMLSVHIKIGVAEGLLTLMLVGMVVRMQPAVVADADGSALLVEQGGGA